jgi:solute carrier family 15 (peptide/histidine transporter), member 3/4
LVKKIKKKSLVEIYVLTYICGVAVNQGLATLAFFGVNVNLVLFLTRVLGQSNGDAANNVSKWTGTVYMFSLIGAFLSDSYWGRYKTCAIFQAIFVLVSRTRLPTY